MWRPRNETDADLARERAAGDIIASAWGVTTTKLSEALYGLDWAFFRQDDLVGWGEYKHRSKRYDTLLLSAAKWMSGKFYAEQSGKPFILFVEWPDGLHWLDTTPIKPVIRLGGNHRGQNGDLEPVVHIPTDAFKKFAHMQIMC